MSCRLKDDPSKREPDGEDCKQIKRDKGDGTFDEVREYMPRHRQSLGQGRSARCRAGRPGRQLDGLHAGAEAIGAKGA
ncbi:MAG: hypothetical protein KBG48_10655 [Kofleriaceae bacterium]|nr:hypothetical protein [Kofleriaceae bacterium]MBP9167841.1 hypothetical protein [Kofleriaceae bacterium]MBP9859348.1 hypothetical protein [Kofleriaceae bacterium]